MVFLILLITAGEAVNSDWTSFALDKLSVSVNEQLFIRMAGGYELDTAIVKLKIPVPDIDIDTPGTALRMQNLLATTPINIVILEGVDEYEDFFITYPFIDIIDNELFFRGGGKILLLRDGFPVNSLKDICFPSVERMEVILENTVIYGNYDAIVNVITKNFHDNLPYSNFKLLKNPDKVQFEFGRNMYSNYNIYLSGDLIEDTSHISCKLDYSSSLFEIGTYYEHYNKEISFYGTLLSYFKFNVSGGFYTFTQEFKPGGERLIVGIDSDGEFIQALWEIKPLLYIAPSVRRAVQKERFDISNMDKFYLKFSAGYSPLLNTIIYGGVSESELNCGVRYYESGINLYKIKEMAGGEIRIISPLRYGLKLGMALGVKDKMEFTEKSVFVDYNGGLMDRRLKWNVAGSLKNKQVRFELQLLDVRLFYKVSRDDSNLYGIKWEFRN